MERILFAAIVQTARILPDLSAGIREMADSLLSSGTRRRIREHVLGDPFVRPTPSQRLRRKFALMDGYRERIGFIIHHAGATAAGALLAARNGGGVSESNRPFDASAPKQRF
jgi:hypothetical protein